MSPVNIKFTIIIPTYKSLQLKQTLLAIAGQINLDCLQEVLVVGQQDPIEAPALPGFRYIEVVKAPTPARNRNIGVQAAQSEWVCFTDSDCQPAPNWLQEIQNAIREDSVAIAGGVSIPQEMPYWGICDHIFGFGLQAIDIASYGEIPYAGTLNFCIRRDIFLALGGFDENFTSAGGEDRDLGWRLERQGYKILNVPTAQVQHAHVRQDFTSAWQHIYHYGCVTAHFRLKYADSNTQIWRLFKKIADIPILGETAGIIRAIFRNLVRSIKHPGYRQQMKYLPGIIILDIAHTLGTIKTLRSIR